MLPTDLTTNQVKMPSGTEIEFARSRSGDSRVEFTSTAGTPNMEHKVTVSHQRVGAGQSRRRRSMVRVDYEMNSQLDTSKIAKTSCYIVMDFPEGLADNYEWAEQVLANLLSFVATTGAATTVLLDGTGTGAVPLIKGTL